MLSPLVTSLLQSQAGMSDAGSFGESTCEGRGLHLTLQGASVCQEAEICRGSPVLNPQTDRGFLPARKGLRLHREEGGGDGAMLFLTPLKERTRQAEVSPASVMLAGSPAAAQA